MVLMENNPATENPNCPDFSSHWQNAADRLFPAGAPEVVDADTCAAIDAAAEAEYQACEGH